MIIVSCIRLIPAFSGINLSLFYLRVYARSVHIVWEQLNKIKLNLNNKSTQEKIDIVSFTFIRVSDTWTVVGSATSYS